MPVAEDHARGQPERHHRYHDVRPSVGPERQGYGKRRKQPETRANRNGDVRVPQRGYPPQPASREISWRLARRPTAQRARSPRGRRATAPLRQIPARIPAPQRAYPERCSPGAGRYSPASYRRRDPTSLRRPSSCSSRACGTRRSVARGGDGGRPARAPSDRHEGRSAIPPEPPRAKRAQRGHQRRLRVLVREKRRQVGLARFPKPPAERLRLMGQEGRLRPACRPPHAVLGCRRRRTPSRGAWRHAIQGSRCESGTEPPP